MSNIVLLPMCMCFLRVRKYKLMSSSMCKYSHLVVQVVFFIAGFFYYKRGTDNRNRIDVHLYYRRWYPRVCTENTTKYTRRARPISEIVLNKPIIL